MRALSGARSGVRLYRLWIKIGTNQRALGEHSHYWTRLGYQTTNPYVHRPVVAKRAVIGSKGGWKLSTIFLSCKVLHDWSIIKLRKYIVFIRRVYLCWGVSQNVPSQTPPNWSKRPQHTKTRLVKRPHKTSPFWENTANRTTPFWLEKGTSLSLIQKRR